MASRRAVRPHPPAPVRSSAPYRVFIHDDTGELTLTFFRAKADWLEKALPVGETVLVSGRAEWFNGRPSMVHPDYMVSADKADTLPDCEPVYPMTAGLSAKVLRRSIESANERVPDFPEWIDGEVLRRQGFPALKEALLALHNPRDATDLEPQAPARRRRQRSACSGTSWRPTRPCPGSWTARRGRRLSGSWRSLAKHVTRWQKWASCPSS